MIANIITTAQHNYVAHFSRTTPKASLSASLAAVLSDLRLRVCEWERPVDASALD